MKPFALLGAVLLTCLPLWSPAAPLPRPGEIVLPRSTPERQGVSSAGLLEFVDALDGIDAVHSVMLVRHGKVVAEGWWGPYNAASNHELYSLSKSFTSTAVGLAIAEGRLSIDDPVLKFFPKDAPAEPSANLKAMRVRDLLSMSTGHQEEPSTAPDKVSPAAFLSQPVPHKPGTHFKYNTAATFMLSAIVQQQTGQTVRDYLQARLFVPLGITQPVWNTNWQGISMGGNGLRVRTEDLAKFGQLYLNHGRWQGRQLLPANWVESATARQVSNGSNPQSDWDQGYGYQFWRCQHGAYRGDGAYGQYCVVFPEQDAVLIITSGVKDMQGILNVVWDKLLPAMKPRALPADAAQLKRLTARLAGLTVAHPAGAATSTLGAAVLGRKFTFPANDQKMESLTLRANPGGPGWRLVTRVDGVESELVCGSHAWVRHEGSFSLMRGEPLAASAAWTSDDTLTVKICAYETPFYATLKLRFAGDQVFHETAFNMGPRATKTAQLIGRME